MDFRFSPEQEKFRQEFEIWLQNNLPDDFNVDRRHNNYDTPAKLVEAYKKFQKKLFEGGYTAMHYPKEYGGQNKSMIEEAIVLQTLSKTCHELREPGAITFGMAVPTIFTCGTEEQKRKHLTNIMNGTHLWCQGFSEPEAGSDVGNVSTTAKKEGDFYIVNGQKVWTSYAHMSDYCILLVRTDTSVRKHQGLSYLLLELKTPGIDIRPMKQISGKSEFNEIFFDDVKVPIENLLGKEGDGWKIAITTLAFERVLGDITKAGLHEKRIGDILALSKSMKRSGRQIGENPVFRQKIARHYTEIMVLKYHGLRNFCKSAKGVVPGPEGSISKILWSEPNLKITDDALMMEGPLGQVVEDSRWLVQDGSWQFDFFKAKGSAIAAGSSEIQRNIIGERVLGLPKDVSRAAILEGGK